MALILATPMTPLHAADADGYYRTLGVGKRTCGEFVEAATRRDAAFTHFVAWLAGYLSAYNRFMPGVSSVTGKRGAMEQVPWLKTYCGDNASAFFSKAAERLIESGDLR